jgi:hypothetical protein
MLWEGSSICVYVYMCVYVCVFHAGVLDCEGMGGRRIRYQTKRRGYVLVKGLGLLGG